MSRNPYKEIGSVIRKAVYPRASNVVVWLTLDGEKIVTLYRFDSEDCVWYWESDWWEGEAEVKLISWCLFEDLKSVTHAHWVEKTFTFECSACCGDAVDNYAYCPRCGAKMDEVVQ